MSVSTHVTPPPSLVGSVAVDLVVHILFFHLSISFLLGTKIERKEKAPLV